MILTDLGILRIDMRIGKCYGDKSPLEGPEGSSVDASEASEEIPTACPGETPYLPSATSRMVCTRIDLLSDSVLFNGETRTRLINT